MVSTLSQDNLSVSSYYTKFKVIWDELVNYKPIPSCSCRICTCGSMAARVEHQEEECTMNFLMGLNESFATVRGQILLMKSSLSSLKKRSKEELVLMPLQLNLLHSSLEVLIIHLTRAIIPTSLMEKGKGQFVHTVGFLAMWWTNATRFMVTLLDIRTKARGTQPIKFQWVPIWITQMLWRS